MTTPLSLDVGWSFFLFEGVGDLFSVELLLWCGSDLWFFELMDEMSQLAFLVSMVDDLVSSDFCVKVFYSDIAGLVQFGG